MIELLTLFVGLFTGPQAVELRVEGVAAVELRLDGRPVGILTGAPWKLEIDFGADLAPHELVVIARDSAGRELDRLQRWVNLSRLPPSGGTTAGGSGGEPRTAVAVVLEPGAELPEIRAMQSWFAGAAEEPLEVVAVDHGAAEVMVVRDPAAQVFLETLREIFLLDVPEDTEDGRQRALRGAFTLGADTRLQFLSPQAAPPSRTSRATNLFGCSPSTPIRQGVLRALEGLGETGIALRLADAAALAGLELQASARRRALVLMIHGDSAEESVHTPEQVRDYLARLQVPVFVWSIGAEAVAWGGNRLLGPVPKLCDPYSLRNPEIPETFLDALAELRQHLERQRIVYLAGRHRPQDVRLLDGAGVRLAGDLRAPPRIATAGALGGGERRPR